MESTDGAAIVVDGLGKTFQVPVRSATMWCHPRVLVVMGVYTIVGGIVGFMVEPNMGQLLSDIRLGTLDYLLTKPADSQLLVSVRQFRLWSLTDVVIGILVAGGGFVVSAPTSARSTSPPSVCS